MLVLRKNKDWNSLPTMGSFLNEFFGNDNLALGYNYKRTNVTENDNSYGISLELPGFKKDDINIGIDNNVMTISSEVEKTNEDYIKREFIKSSFKNEFRLPEDVDIDNINATMENGILSITLNKIKMLEDETKSIKIKIN